MQGRKLCYLKIFCLNWMYEMDQINESQWLHGNSECDVLTALLFLWMEDRVYPAPKARCRQKCVFVHHQDKIWPLLQTKSRVDSKNTFNHLCECLCSLSLSPSLCVCVCITGRDWLSYNPWLWLMVELILLEINDSPWKSKYSNHFFQEFLSAPSTDQKSKLLKIS